MTVASNLRKRLSDDAILVAPGIYDAFSAFHAEVAGCEAVFVSGSALAAAHLARPDIGLLTATETCEIVSRISERISIPIFVDADQGFGNRFNVARTVKALERAGAAAIQIEDQQEVKPNAEPLSRPLISAEAMSDKIKAARDSLINQNVIISARTDAMSSEGFDASLERANLYIEAGADMIFVETLSKRAQMEKLVGQLGHRVPLLHNLLRPTDEITDAQTAQEIGYSVALFPGAALGAVGEALENALGNLHANPKLNPDARLKDRIGSGAFLSGQG
ncbi:MAG: isocitrate lyase/PEP mutase family protein [Erythrobacter sp.]|uniref:isocitrate lyase/PEP mutase family protein n=1 Tax=Erythrobacter sp. TaxID=1042 RepID=UPI00326352D1